MVLNLDTKDRKILSILDMDARMPLSQIGKKVGLSREVVYYRIQQMEKKGIIEGYYTVVDICKIGLMYCRMFFNFRSVTKKIEDEFTAFCKHHPHLTWLLYGEGQYDVAVTVVARDLLAIERVHDEVQVRFGKYLQNPYLSFAFRIYHYKHNCLYETNDFQEMIMGEAYSTRIKLDTLDYSLIDILNQKATLSLVELGVKLRISAKLVSNRMQKLMDGKIILGFRAKINTRLLGYDHYKVFLTLQNFDLREQMKLKSYLQQHTHVIYVTRPMGMHNYEFEILVRNANHLHEIMMELRERFSNIFVSYQTNLYYSEPLVSYCPIEKQLQREFWDND